MANELTKKILEACGDVLLKVWADNGNLVPNATVSTTELNKRILEYQELLDDLELEIQQGIENSKQTPAPPSAELDKDMPIMDFTNDTFDYMNF